MSLTRKQHTHLHASLHHNTGNSTLCYICGVRMYGRNASNFMAEMTSNSNLYCHPACSTDARVAVSVARLIYSDLLHTRLRCRQDAEAALDVADNDGNVAMLYQVRMMGRGGAAKAARRILADQMEAAGTSRFAGCCTFNSVQQDTVQRFSERPAMETGRDSAHCCAVHSCRR